MAITAAQLNVVVTSSGVAQTRGEIAGLGKDVDNTGLSLGKLGGMGAAAFLGLGKVMQTGIGNAAALQQSITNVSASLGGLNSAELAQLTRDMQELGINSQYSATEVAGVAEELAKAGYATDSMRDMSEAVINLAQATGDSLGTAVTGIVQAMSTWDPALVGVANGLDDASRAADILTIAANESTASVDDIIRGMRNLGPIAANMGVGFDEAAAAIAVFTNYGMRGADAGVSLARGLQNLAAPTDAVAKKLSDLGLSMEGLGIQAFDLEGNFVGFPELFRQLQAGLSGFSDEVKLAALSAIFGAEAMDVMALAIQSGADPLEEIIGLMQEQGVAAEQAAMRTDTLSGAWQRMQEAIGTLLGSLMGGLVGPLQTAADMAANAAEAISALPGPIRNVIGVALAATTALIGLNAAMNLMAAGAGRLGIVSALAGGGGVLGGLRGAGSLAGSLLGLGRVINPLTVGLGALALAGAGVYKIFQNIQETASGVAAGIGLMADEIERLKLAGSPDIASELEKTLDGLQKQVDLIEGSEWEKIVEKLKLPPGTQFIDIQGPDGLAQQIKTAGQLYDDFAETVTANLNSITDPAAKQAYLDWVNDLLSGVTYSIEGTNLDDVLQQAITTPASEVPGVMAAIEASSKGAAGGVNTLAASFEKLAAAADVRALFDQLPADLDDLRIDGSGRIADDIETLGKALQEAFAPQYTAMSDDWADPAFAALATNAMQASEIGEEAMGRLGTAWGRLQDKMATGDFDNARIMADVLNVLGDADLKPDEKVAAIEAISNSLADYKTGITAAQEAMVDWLANGDNFLGFWLEYQEQANAGGMAAVRTQEAMDRLQARADFRALVQFTADLDAAQAGLDSVLNTFGQIDSLASSSNKAGSIAEALVGEPGVWHEIDNMLQDGRISLEQYNAAVAAGHEIQWSNARVQEDLNEIRRAQLPLLAEEQAAYEKQIAALADLSPLEQRRALAMQDSAVQAQLASLYSTAYAASLGEIPQEVATSMIVSAAEADPVLKDLLLQFGLIEEGANGEISVNFPHGETVQSAITNLTTSINALIETLGGDVPELDVKVNDEAGSKVDTLTERIREFRREAEKPITGAFNALRNLVAPEGGPVNPITGVQGPLVTQLPNTGTGPAPQVPMPKIPDMTAEATAAGQAAGAALTQGLLNALPTFVTAVQAFGTNLTTAGATMQTAGTTAGQGAGTGIAQGALNALPTFAAAMAGFTTVINTEAANMASAGVNAGAVAGYGVANGIDSAQGAIAGSVGAWVGIIDGAAGAMGAAGFNAGAAAGFGVANGLDSAAGAVEAAAGRIVAAANAAMIAAGQIHSPSRLTRDAVGKPLGEGVVAGIEAMLPAVRDASGRLITSAGFTSPSVAAYSGYGAGVSGGGTFAPTVKVEIHVNGSDMDEEKLAELAGERVMQALGHVLDDARRGNGLVMA